MAISRYAVVYPITKRLDQHLSCLFNNLRPEWDWYAENTTEIKRSSDLDGIITEEGNLIIPEVLCWREGVSAYKECRDQVFRLYKKYKFSAPTCGLSITIIDVHM